MSTMVCTPVESNNESTTNLINIMEDVSSVKGLENTDGAPTTVKESTEKGAKEIKKEGGFKETLKNLGKGLLQGLLQLLTGILTTAGSLLMGRGGMGMGMMGMGGNPLGMLMGGMMGNSFWGGNSNVPNNTYSNPREMEMARLEPMLKNIMNRLESLTAENRDLKSRMKAIGNIVKGVNDRQLGPTNTFFNGLNNPNMLKDYGNILYSGNTNALDKFNNILSGPTNNIGFTIS